MNILSSHSTATPAAEDSVADLELRILDSSGKLLASADLGGNVEVVKLTNLRAGTYTMQVVVKNTAVRKIYYSLAWW